MKVMKFGGSSLASPATVRQVGEIVLAARRREPVIVVVSAFKGVTNQLLECARLAERSGPGYEEAFDRIATSLARVGSSPRTNTPATFWREVTIT